MTLILFCRRFDIGIYTTLTSINPLRVYIYQGDWLIRFCPKVYYPFDAADRDKYVITDDYRPVWKVPSLQKMYTDLDFTRKEALLAYLRNKGLDGVKLDSDLQAAIRGVYLDKESSLIDSLSRYPSSRNFFEMVRFDFVLDKHLNIYLMEVNMSPNLSSGHFSDNKLLYEQVIYSMLSLVGLARAVNNDFARSGTDERNMQVSSKDVHVYLNECLSDKCNSNCISEECKFCGMCVKSEDLEHMTAAYMEHSNRQTWRRVFPVPFKDQFTAQVWEPKQDQDYQKLNERNQWMTLWFHGKCLQDSSWCR